MKDDERTATLPSGKVVPVIPPLPEPEPGFNDDTVAVCGQCGIHIKKVMHFSCPDPRCPVQMKPTL